MTTIEQLNRADDIAGRGGFETQAAGADANATADSSGKAAPPQNYSTTNTQVEGVDEADIVKNTGEFMYLLHDNTLKIIDTWPAEQTHEIGSIDIEGRPSELFIDRGKAIVFSNVTDPRQVDQCAQHGGDFRYDYYYCYGNFTKITVIDLASETAEREIYVQGNYRTSRRQGDRVLAVLQNWRWYYGFDLPSVWEYLYGSDYNSYPKSETEYRERVLRWRADAIIAVRDTVIRDWLPTHLEREDGVLVEQAPNCDGYLFPRAGYADYGMTETFSFDLADDTSGELGGIYGYAQTVYANADKLVIAQPDWSVWSRAYRAKLESWKDSTFVHSFDWNKNGLDYSASGILPGRLNDQFSLDQRGEVLRAAVTQTTYRAWWREWNGEWTPPARINRVLTLSQEFLPGFLSLKGTTKGLAEGESIQSARFMGDIAYIVTFRNIDPLFAVDLKDENHPRVLGELKIPGFSTYIHKLDDDHLLTIGYDADPETGRRLGLALQIFDVENPTNPTQKHRHVFKGGDSSWSWSEAAWNHKAFTFYGHLNALAFPHSVWNWNEDTHSSRYHSSLELFDVRADKGFTKLGSLDHTDLLGNSCPQDDYSCYGWRFPVRRGAFVEDYVYSISYGGMLVHKIDDLQTELARVNF